MLQNRNWLPLDEGIAVDGEDWRLAIQPSLEAIVGRQYRTQHGDAGMDLATGLQRVVEISATLTGIQ